MSQTLAGKVAIVTGSSRSIGAAIAARLQADGASVVVNYVSNESAAQKVVDSLNKLRPKSAVAIKADVSDVSASKKLVEKTIEEFGKIDILVLNAGIMGTSMFADVDEKSFDDHFAINVKGPFFLAQAAAKHMTAGGRIIFISSTLTRISAVMPVYAVYAATKGAVEQFTRVLAKDLGTRGITVNTVSPGPVDTELLRESVGDEAIGYIGSLNPFNRIAKPEDIAPVISFVAGPDAAWISGQNIPVNGAWSV